VLNWALSSVQIDRVCYLCIDMNIARPELTAMEHFWARLVLGAPSFLTFTAGSRIANKKLLIDLRGGAAARF